MKPFVRVTSHAVVLSAQNIDTDQIIPARFLKVTSRTGLGKHLFSDWRYDNAGVPYQEFVLNTPAALTAKILVAGDNFGCGSSREHAPWALVDFGFQVVISTRMADIFRSNALKNGLLPVVVAESLLQRLLAGEGNPLSIDLEQQTLTLADQTRVAFAVEPFARYLLLNGIDELDFLLQQQVAVSVYEQEHPCTL